MRKFFMAVLAVCVLSQPAWAAFDLQVTEMWPGNEPGENQTSDWFEVTNVGDMDWTSADGTLYFDDSKPSIENADEMFGISTIAAGESVIFVDDDLDIPTVSVNIWKALWTPALTAAGKSVPQVGYYAGSGLSGGGDEVNLFLDTNATLEVTDIIDTEEYVDGDAFGGRSWDVGLSVYTSVGFGAITGPNDMGNRSMGTPGFLGTVPEPTSLAMIVSGMFSMFLGIRRK